MHFWWGVDVTQNYVTKVTIVYNTIWNPNTTVRAPWLVAIKVAVASAE
jgi:hypothetical protein